MRTRDEHIQFCKERALEYLGKGDVLNAITSMLTDLDKHPETKAVGESMSMVALLYAMNKDLAGAKRFIEGFR